MMTDRMQAQRFERKYFISERQAQQVREFVSGYLQPDEYSAGRADGFYEVHSLYLDSDELATYWATVHCEKKGFKLRVRYYDDDPSRRCSSRSSGAKTSASSSSAAQSIAARVTAARRTMPGPEHLITQKPAHLAVATILPPCRSTGASHRPCGLLARSVGKPARQLGTGDD